MKTKKLLLNALPLLLVGGVMAYAAAPTGGYLPNATLDPDCAPGDADCFVQLAPDLTSVWDNADGTVADETGSINYTEGNVGIGITNPSAKLSIMDVPKSSVTPQDASVEIFSDGGNMHQIYRFSDTSGGPDYIQNKARGTYASPSSVINNDTLANWRGRGFDGSTYRNGPAIQFRASENWTSSNVGGNIRFSVTPNGTTSNIEAMRISDYGDIGIGIADPSSKLHIENTTSYVLKSGETLCPSGYSWTFDADRNDLLEEGDVCHKDEVIVIATDDTCPAWFTYFDVDDSSDLNTGDRCYPNFDTLSSGGIYLSNNPERTDFNSIADRSSISIANKDTNGAGNSIGISDRQLINRDGTYYTRTTSFTNSKHIPAGITDNGYLVGSWVSQWRNREEDGSLPHLDDGTLKSIRGLVSTVGHWNTGTGNPQTNQVYGMQSTVYARSGIIGTAYGLYLTDAISGSGSITNNYGIYQASENQRNFFKGDIGVGIAPTSELHIQNNAADETVLKVLNNNSSGGKAMLRVGYSDTASMDIYRDAATADIFFDANQGNGAVRFQDAGVDTMIISNTGNIGVGTITPSEKLEVQGAIKIDTTTSACNTSTHGSIKFESDNFYGCKSTGWVQLNP